MRETLLERYRRLLAERKAAPGSAQDLAARKLQFLTDRLSPAPPARTGFTVSAEAELYTGRAAGPGISSATPRG